MRPSTENVSTKNFIDVGERRAASATGLAFRQVLLSVMIFYVVAGALNGHHLHEAASRRAYGPGRTFWMTVTAPLDRISQAAGLYRFRQFFEPVLENNP